MTFYEKVLKEFKNGNDSYICHGSLTFEKAWKGETKRLKIIRDAEKFWRLLVRWTALVVIVLTMVVACSDQLIGQKDI